MVWIFLFDSQLFWYRLVFMTELLFAEGLFTFTLRRRNLFALRAVCSLLACYALTFLFPILSFDAIYTSVMFIALFAMTILALYVCFREPLLNIVFCAIASYAVQHTAYELYTFLVSATGLGAGSAAYGGQSVSSGYSAWTAIIYADSYAVAYWLMYVFFGMRIDRKEELRIDNVALLVLSALIVLVAIVLNAVITYRIDEDTDGVLIGIMHIYNLLCCVLALFIQFSMLGKKHMMREIDTLHQLREQEQQHYRIFKENIDYINIKCHDLKHQIRRIGEHGAVDAGVLSEIENAVEIYDSDVKTGNEALDVILTEKRLQCVNNGITLSCIADGKQLDFMASADLYSLFGNALDNAIEAVGGIGEEGKRTIGLTVKHSRNFLSIGVRNYYAGEVVFEGGLPRTTKGDKIYHGYGMKSMKQIVDRYGGEISVVTEGDIFALHILFPLADS